MQVSAEDVRTLRRLKLDRLGAAAPTGLLASMLILIALRCGGYYAESWGLPTIVCGWIVAESARGGDALVGQGGRNHRILAVRFHGPPR
jgi:hypothetical protein